MDNTTSPSEQDGDGVFSAVDLERLESNQKLRQRLIEKLTKGDSVPETKDEKALLTNLMNAADASILSKARVRIASNVEKTSADFVELARQTILNHRNTPRVHNPKDLEIPSSIAFTLGVPGDVEIGLKNLTPLDIVET